jgi:hypothetical protein
MNVIFWDTALSHMWPPAERWCHARLIFDGDYVGDMFLRNVDSQRTTLLYVSEDDNTCKTVFLRQRITQIIHKNIYLRLLCTVPDFWSSLLGHASYNFLYMFLLLWFTDNARTMTRQGRRSFIVNHWYLPSIGTALPYSVYISELCYHKYVVCRVLTYQSTKFSLHNEMTVLSGARDWHDLRPVSGLRMRRVHLHKS